MSQTLFVACTRGLEAPLLEELRELALPAAPAPGGCLVEDGPDGALVTANVQSRLASRVSWRLGQATTPAGLGAIPVRQLLGPGPAKLTVTTQGRVRPPPEVWRTAAERAFGLGREGLELSLRLDDGGAELWVDTSGELLYRRGARQETGKAPLRETLAAGLLRLARWSPGEPLWDVMCGSGTIVLEAAERSLGLQPGRARPFVFEAFPSVSATALTTARAPTVGRPTTLLASDLNAGALGVARRNARRAGVEAAITFERLDATRVKRPPTEPGLLLANLPYGKRVGSRFELAGLYAAVGASVRRELKGWRFGFLLEQGEEALGLPLSHIAPITNGGLSCQFVMGSM